MLHVASETASITFTMSILVYLSLHVLFNLILFLLSVALALISLRVVFSP